MKKPHKIETIVTHTGTNPRAHKGVVNPPVYHASTITFESYAHLSGKLPTPYQYGRRGTDGDRYLRDSINALECAAESLLAPSGLLAINMILMAHARSGVHFLISDNCYQPVRHFCDVVLTKFGVKIDYFNPMDSEAFAKKFKPETEFVWFESPGTMTFEVCDLPKLVSIVKNNRGVKCGIDNTWSGGMFLKPLNMGVDYSAQAGTKYIVGHSDVMLGTIACRTMEDYNFLFAFHYAHGAHTAPDDIYLAHRGLRTIAVRMQYQQTAALKIAQFLAKHKRVKRVLHPALPSCEGHEFWARDFSGSSGLFSFILKEECNDEQMGKILDNMDYFAMGYSWGGYESLMIPGKFTRTQSQWNEKGQMFRLNIGLEAVDDLIEDLDRALKRAFA